MSATDPLREALTAKLAEMELHDDLPDSFDQGYMAAWREFREALAVVPSEPNSTCVHDAEAKSEGEKLGAPAEPERASLSEALLDESPNYGSEHCVCGNVATPARDCPVHWALWVAERHRPAEPEAWEWRAGDRWWSSGTHATEAEAREGHEQFTGRAPDWVTRRRPGTAPGPWERVDPEPRQED